MTPVQLPLIPERLRAIVVAAAAADDVLVVDFPAMAQEARAYADDAEKLATAGTAEHANARVGLAGSKKAVNRLMGSLPLYR